MGVSKERGSLDIGVGEIPSSIIVISEIHNNGYCFNDI